MGSARWSASSYATYTASVADKSRDEVFRSRSLNDGLDPKKFKLRESVDSTVNPNSTPIILACDVTGSMGELAEIIVKRGLGVIMESIYSHKPVLDPHICCMATGDATCDSAPLQVTQFEAGVDPLVKQIEDIFIGGGGGGNAGESYILAWWYAAYKVKQDAFAKRGRKGYLFTIGDEAPLPVIRADEIRKFMGVGCQQDIPAKELLEIIEKFWNVYHIIVKPVGTQPVLDSWRNLLGQRAIVVKNHEKLAEVIVTIIGINEGVDANKVKADFDGDTKAIVTEATKKLLPAGV